jgi:hypothetical protein
MADDRYQDLLARAWARHQAAGNGLRPEGVAAGIAAAINEFKAPLTSATAAIAKQTSGRYRDAQAYAADADGALRSLAFQRGVLQAAIARAGRADQVRINAAAALDRAGVMRLAKAQQAADGALGAGVDALIRRLSRDLAAAARAVRPEQRAAKPVEAKKRLRRSGSKAAEPKKKKAARKTR